MMPNWMIWSLCGPVAFNAAKVDELTVSPVTGNEVIPPTDAASKQIASMDLAAGNPSS